MGGFDPVWLFIVVGVVMFMLGFAGCIGALRENTVLLKFRNVTRRAEHGRSLAATLRRPLGFSPSPLAPPAGLVWLPGSRSGFLLRLGGDWIKDQLNFFINNNVKAYRDDIDLQNLIDFAQNYWSCCGAHGPNDWNLNIYFNCSENNPSRERCGVPFSCCVKDPAEDVINTQCGYDVRLQAFSVFLGTDLLLELTAGVLAFVFKRLDQRPAELLHQQQRQGVPRRHRPAEPHRFLHKTTGRAAEPTGPTTGNLNIYFNCSENNPSRERCGVPFSCCVKDPAEDVINTQCGYDVRLQAVGIGPAEVHQHQGCVGQFEKWLQGNLIAVAGVFVGVALLQVGAPPQRRHVCR
ncbi:hypothetical protein CRUP_012157 [Coryphaenoides rupestris]|nr:hypothetical protein CRUP_012157 [Coryphaenoides rupestris]